MNILNILILGNTNQQLDAFINQLAVLNERFVSTNSEVSIRLHVSSRFSSIMADQEDLATHEFMLSDQNSIKSVAQEADVDIIFDDTNALTDRFARNNFYIFEVVKSVRGLAAACEEFLLGHGVVGLFSNNMWSMPLLMRYYSRPGICANYFNFIGECTDIKSYTVEQKERVRYIANRIGQIEYSKDIIQSYIKRKRKAERNGYTQQDYDYELNYHLGNYYFLIAGALDSVARLLNEVLHLRLTRYSTLALEKPSFIDANRRRRTGYVRILTNREFVNWITFLKERRNFIAHEGDMRQVPIVQQNETPLTDDEVDSIVDTQMDWAFAVSVQPARFFAAMRAQARELVRIERDYTEIAKNAMIIPNEDGYKIYYPLPSINYDYEQLAKVLSKLLERLKR